MSGEKVLLVGLRPDVVDYDKWPQLTPEKLMAALHKDQATLKGLGLDAALCLVDTGATAEHTVGEALASADYACVSIGAGVRTDPDHLLLFEKLINAVHRSAPHAAICFNTKPDDTAAAVRRWVKVG